MPEKHLTENPILDTDSYKFSHFKQYPPGTIAMTDYLESRGGKYPATVMFGLLYILERYLTTRITVEMVEEAKALAHAHGVPFNYEGWLYIAKNKQGRLPVQIDAVPEGSVVPTHNILLRMTSTDPKAFWVVGWLEAMVQRLWYPTTVATQSHYIKRMIKSFLEKTGDVSGLPFKLHDFGCRGVSSQESAAIGGAAHLINFMGTDTVPALRLLANYYNEPMAGFSIPAAEHSTITAWGRDGEEEAYRNMLTQFARPGSILAVVSDSYDLWNAIDAMWGGSLRQQVIDSGATVVIRPDSGNPIDVVTRTIAKLDVRFGTKVNDKGYHVLNNVRVIQGDGVNAESIQAILERLTYLRYSTDNIAFGMGGALLQGVNRDTQKFAIKCSGIWLNDGTFRPVYKDPATDPGKKSKSGHLDLEYDGQTWKTVTGAVSANSALMPAFLNGEVRESYRKSNTLADIRRRADAAL